MALDNNTLTVNENTITQGSESVNDLCIKSKSNLSTDPNYHPQWKTEMVVYYAVIHLGAIYGLYLTVTLKPMIFTLIWAFLVAVVNFIGIMIGAHRGYSHKSYKLTTAGQILLLVCQTTSGQGSSYTWARDHRLHHKYESTDADPYNIRRGFFFSHIGWLMSRKHPLVLQKGKEICADLEKNKLVMFQNKHIISLMILLCVVIPTIVPIFGWGENFWNSLFVSFFLRYCYVLNISASINSFAHWDGSQPFDGRVTARQWTLAHIILGTEERTHNYHHAFPYDPAFTEFGLTGFGVGTIFLRCLQRIGWAYDLKVVPESLIYKHSKRYGDGSFTLSESDIKAERYIPKNNSW